MTLLQISIYFCPFNSILLAFYVTSYDHIHIILEIYMHGNEYIINIIIINININSNNNVVFTVMNFNVYTAY